MCNCTGDLVGDERMRDINTGGPAFPCTNHHGQKLTGMELRDYFAAKALQGFCAAEDTGNWSRSEMAEASYQMADAMLRAREK
jgi:hypothetical protein